jgi:hypothetical protein
MGQTPIYQLPYPELTDPADVPTDMRELAERTETVFGGLGAGDLTRIADVKLAAAAANIDLQNIPQTFGHLLLLILGRSTAAVPIDSLNVRVNNITGANYYALTLRGSGSAASVVPSIGSTSVVLSGVPGATATDAANVRGGGLLLIPNYAATDGYPTMLAMTGLTGGVATNIFVDQLTVLCNVAAAVNRITLTCGSGSVAAGARATLFGLRGT